jgi:DNA end-binding protein Ku
MAEQLISSMADTFDPTAYRDEYRDALMGVIEAKVAGEKPQPAEKAEPTRIGDLMAALEASVAAAREARRTPAEEKAEDQPAKAAGGKAASGKAASGKAASGKAASGKAATRGRKKAEADVEEAPARRRKTA